MRPTVCPSGVPSLRRFPASKETKTRFAQASVLGLPAENLLSLAALTWGEGHKTPLFLCNLFSPPLRLSGTSSRSGSLNSCARCRPNNRPTPKHRSRNDNNRLPILEANQGATSPKTYPLKHVNRPQIPDCGRFLLWCINRTVFTVMRDIRDMLGLAGFQPHNSMWSNFRDVYD